MPPRSYWWWTPDGWITSPVSPFSQFGLIPRMNITFTTKESPVNHVIIYGSRNVYQTMASTADEAITKFEKESFTDTTKKFVVYRTGSLGNLAFVGEYEFTSARRSWTNVG